LVLGGSRSGKSAFAESLALERRDVGGVCYVATADARDGDMAARIDFHRSRRPAEWSTWEKDPASLADEMERLTRSNGVLLLDCLTMFLTRLALASPAFEGGDGSLWRAEEERILDMVSGIFSNFSRAAAGTEKRLIAVSGEVGCGVIPAYRTGRRFADLQGRANQRAAEMSDEAALLSAGIPLWLKRGERGAGS
jgi:adenosylcobinamide kinase/adenosylcobinamide-phosphate guanylyltransferase